MRNYLRVLGRIAGQGTEGQQLELFKRVVMDGKELLGVASGLPKKKEVKECMCVQRTRRL